MPRWFLAGLVVSVLLLSAVFAKFYGVSVTASLWEPGGSDNGGCRSNAPINVTLKNFSFRRVARAEISLEVWVDGRAKSVLIDPPERNFDLIAPPFSIRSMCFSDSLFDWDDENERGDNSAISIITNANRFMASYAKFRENAQINVMLESVTFR
ncbi:hypothetical protein [Ruegeria arenilitoris]|uniref:hypothetical protein n=1 Tax=Ruegeria arenilitoris TaxID=1173585 RepID=UPI001132195E|nr:hypothetical protein [Ruegeria arenilitoris]